MNVFLKFPLVSLGPLRVWFWVVLGSLLGTLGLVLVVLSARGSPKRAKREQKKSQKKTQDGFKDVILRTLRLLLVLPWATDNKMKPRTYQDTKTKHINNYSKI